MDPEPRPVLIAEFLLKVDPNLGPVVHRHRDRTMTVLPQPGNARRRLMRLHGIKITDADYSAEELFMRGR
jgi:hypothetical protein